MQPQHAPYRPLTFRKVSKKEPCPICAHPDWCGIAEDGSVHCMRKESPVPAKSGDGWWHNLPKEQINLAELSTAYLTIQSAFAAAEAPAPEAASAEDCDSVYRTLLGVSSLTTEHTEYLAREGIPQARWWLYGSLGRNRDRIARELRRLYSPELLRRVPGIYLRADNQLAIGAADGLLLGVANANGRIVGMSCRSLLDDGARIYRWLSSAAHGGPGSGSPAHVARGELSTQVYITEGQKKAEYVAAATGHYAIGMAGHTSQQAALAQLDLLIERGTLCVIVALDEDSNPQTAVNVDRSRTSILAALHTRGLAVRLARWDSSVAKGIDDLLRVGHTPTLSVALPSGLTTQMGARTGAAGCSCEEARKYRTLTQVLRGPLPDTEKLVLMGTAAVLGPAPEVKQHVYVDQVVEACGLTSTRSPQTARKRAGQALLYCAEAGIIERDASDRNPVNDHVRLQFALNPALLPLPGAQLPNNVRKEKDVRRHHACEYCGSTLLAIICRACNRLQQDALQHVAACDPGSVYNDQAPQTSNLDSRGLNFWNPEVASDLLPDSRSRSAKDMSEPGTDTLPDQAFRMTAYESVLFCLVEAPVPLPQDMICLRAEITMQETRTGLQIGMRAKTIREVAPLGKNGGVRYEVIPATG